MSCVGVLKRCCACLVLLATHSRADALVDAPGVQLVERHCTSCHSELLVVQNNATRDGWKRLIRWMQSSQGLWPLGEDEEKILKYLSTYYGPLDDPGRPGLTEHLLPSYGSSSNNK